RRLAEADSIVRRTEAPTPLVWSPALSKRYGREVWLKLESLSPIRSFKHRWALVALDKLESAVVTASTGNHGQGVAYAAGRRGIPATVVVPTNALESKVEAIRSLGARVIVAGANLSEAQRSAEAIAAETGSRYLEDG